MVRILHILPRVPIGGVGSFLMNAQKSIKKDMFSFDYLIFENVFGATFPNVVKEMGSNVYLLNEKLSLLNAFKIKKKLNEFFYAHAKEYDIVHLHSANVGMLVFSIAKKYGIKVRILHAHATQFSDSWMKSIRNWIIEAPVLKYCTNLMACGKKAGDFQFKNRAYDVVYNGIDTIRFNYKYFERQKRFVIGHVGNFNLQKNHIFLLKLMKFLKNTSFDCEMWLAGSGILENDIKESVKQNGLENQIKFLGKVDNTENFYNQIDLFVLPSLYEGFPVALMEAQACGVPIICSSTITREVDFYKDCLFLPIDVSGVEKWAKAILENVATCNREDKAIAFQKSLFTIHNTVSHLEKLYIKYIGMCEA